MITAFTMLGGLFIVLGMLWYRDSSRTRNGRKLDHQMVQEISPRIDTKWIEETEAEIFGIGVDIRDLPGCTWKVERGSEYKKRDGEERVDEKGLTISLLDESGEALHTYNVYSVYRKRQDIGYHPFWTTERRSIAEIEKEVQLGMAALVEKELAKRKYEAGMQNILDTYNGKAVEVL